MSTSLHKLATDYLQGRVDFKHANFYEEAENAWGTKELQLWQHDAMCAFKILESACFNIMCDKCDDSKLFQYIENICISIIAGIVPEKPTGCGEWCVPLYSNTGATSPR